MNLPDDEQWQRYGSCWGSFDPSFFPDTYGGRRAIAICEKCPVEEICLDYAIVTNQRHGVWGGKTRSQRLKIRYRDRDAQKSQIQTQGPVPSTTQEASEVGQVEAQEAAIGFGSQNEV